MRHQYETDHRLTPDWSAPGRKEAGISPLDSVDSSGFFDAGPAGAKCPQSLTDQQNLMAAVDDAGEALGLELVAASRQRAAVLRGRGARGERLGVVHVEPRGVPVGAARRAAHVVALEHEAAQAGREGRL